MAWASTTTSGEGTGWGWVGEGSLTHLSAQSWRPIVEEIDHRFDQYEQAESQLERNDIADPRIHCCLYFIEPCFHG